MKVTKDIRNRIVKDDFWLH